MFYRISEHFNNFLKIYISVQDQNDAMCSLFLSLGRRERERGLLVWETRIGKGKNWSRCICMSILVTCEMWGPPPILSCEEESKMTCLTHGILIQQQQCTPLYYYYQHMIFSMYALLCIYPRSQLTRANWLLLRWGGGRDGPSTNEKKKKKSKRRNQNEICEDE